MTLPEHIKDLVVVVLVLAVVMALGVYVGRRPGPHQAYAQALEQVLVLRNMQLQEAQERAQEMADFGIANERARFSDAVRLLDNMVRAVEGDPEMQMEEALAQAKHRLDEWR